MQLLKKYLLDTPNDVFLNFALGKEFEKNGDDNSAMVQFELVRELDVNYVGNYYHLGKCLERLHQENEANEVYIKGMEIARKLKDDHSYNELAGAKLSLGLDDDSEEI